jgi:hypothetical protein
LFGNAPVDTIGFFGRYRCHRNMTFVTVTPLLLPVGFAPCRFLFCLGKLRRFDGRNNDFDGRTGGGHRTQYTDIYHLGPVTWAGEGAPVSLVTEATGATRCPGESDATLVLAPPQS